MGFSSVCGAFIPRPTPVAPHIPHSDPQPDPSGYPLSNPQPNPVPNPQPTPHPHHTHSTSHPFHSHALQADPPQIHIPMRDIIFQCSTHLLCRAGEDTQMTQMRQIINPPSSGGPSCLVVLTSSDPLELCGDHFGCRHGNQRLVPFFLMLMSVSFFA